MTQYRIKECNVAWIDTPVFYPQCKRSWLPIWCSFSSDYGSLDFSSLEKAQAFLDDHIKYVNHISTCKIHPYPVS